MQRYEVLVVGSGGAGPTASMLLSKLGVDHPRAQRAKRVDLDPKVAALLDTQRVGTVATVSAAGQPRQSVVYFAREGARILISTERDRLKARDVERTGWASLCVHGDEPPFPSATVAGPAAILSQGIGEGTARVMQRITGGDEPPEPQTDEALAAVGRVLLVIDIERTGPTNYL